MTDARVSSVFDEACDNVWLLLLRVTSLDQWWNICLVSGRSVVQSCLGAALTHTSAYRVASTPTLLLERVAKTVAYLRVRQSASHTVLPTHRSIRAISRVVGRYVSFSI